jgi:hypothetical protein
MRRCLLQHAGNVWLRYDLVHPKKKGGEAMLSPSKDELSNEELFETMLFYKRCVCCAVLCSVCMC